MMGVNEIEKFCALDKSAENALRTAIDKLFLSARAYHGILRVARTIADLEGRSLVSTEHILEAVAHRRYGDDPFDVFEV
jgi:magnesium chelatase family protein